MYGSPVAEIAEAAEMKRLVGICPQFNIIFDVLTVEEHLKMFAAIKGIPPADVDAEVKDMTNRFFCFPSVVGDTTRYFGKVMIVTSICLLFQVDKVLKDLDLDKIRMAQAKNLSGGQKRKLSVGIAILGDPKVRKGLSSYITSGPESVSSVMFPPADPSPG